ncbi:MAG: hypothetical protein J6R45_00015 [Clostridia bacterium]|nr:hypothetical protein [Clostridia bacterium]
MIAGKKYINEDIIYTVFKKHYCPDCKVRLKRIEVSKIVNSKSPEAKKYDLSMGDTFMTGDIEVVWKEFQCPNCLRIISVKQMKRIEGFS